MSANPGGRPAVFAEVRAAAQEQGLASIQKLVEIRDNPKAPFIVQIAAANSLLDRGYGRPMQGVAVQNLPAPLPPPMVNKQMTPAEAMRAYEATLHSEGHLPDSGADPQMHLIDVTPNAPDKEDDDGQSS